MCGIFGIISKNAVSRIELKLLATHAEQRGKDSSGLFSYSNNKYTIYRSSESIPSLLKKIKINKSFLVMGHGRLITNGLSDNQPVFQNSVCVIHNGIIVNHEALWLKLKFVRSQVIDTEIINAIAADFIEKGGDVNSIAEKVLSHCDGVVACALALPKLGKLCLFSNNGSLYVGKKGEVVYFSSEIYPLEKLKCESIEQVRQKGKVLPSSTVCPTEFPVTI